MRKIVGQEVLRHQREKRLLKFCFRENSAGSSEMLLENRASESLLLSFSNALHLLVLSPGNWPAHTDPPTPILPHLWVKRGSGSGRHWDVCSCHSTRAPSVASFVTGCGGASCVAVWGWGSWIVWGQVCPFAFWVMIDGVREAPPLWGWSLCVPGNVQPGGLTTSLTPVNSQPHRKEVMGRVCGRRDAREWGHLHALRSHWEVWCREKWMGFQGLIWGFTGHEIQVRSFANKQCLVGFVETKVLTNYRNMELYK